MGDVSAVARYYGRWARLYDLVARRTPGVATARERAIDLLRLSPGDTAVEMGCGTGANLPYLREQVGPSGRVVGVDLTPGVLTRARELVTRNGWTNVHLVRGDAATPPVEAGIDGVLATFVVGMLDDPGAAVTDWCGNLSPGGGIALLDAARSAHPIGRRFNPAFEWFVTLTSPPGTRLRYEEPPADVLDRRVRAARAALADRTIERRREARAVGFLRVCAGSRPSGDLGPRA